MTKVEIIDLTCRTAPYDAHLAKALGRKGVEVRLWIAGCLPPQRDALEDVELARTFKLSERIDGSYPAARRILKTLEYPANLCKFLFSAIKSKPDIVHFQWLPAPASLTPVESVVLRVLRTWRIGVVLTIHDIEPELSTTEELDDLPKLAREVDRIICHTQEACERLCCGHGIDKDKVAVIPHGPLGEKAASRNRATARQRVGYDAELVHGLFFGRVEPYKGIEFLIDGWALLEGEVREQAVMHIVGKASPDYRRVIERKIDVAGVRKSMTTRFKYVSEDELADHVAAADLCVFPYRAITQSGAVMYALGAGKPVIATRVGGLREVLEDRQSALLVDYGDGQGCAEAMAKLLGNETLRERLGQAAEEAARGSYGWGRIAEETRALYSACRQEDET